MRPLGCAGADVERVKREIEEIIGLDCSEALSCSAKKVCGRGASGGGGGGGSASGWAWCILASGYASSNQAEAFGECAERGPGPLRDALSALPLRYHFSVCLPTLIHHVMLLQATPMKLCDAHKQNLISWSSMKWQRLLECPQLSEQFGAGRRAASSCTAVLQGEVGQEGDGGGGGGPFAPVHCLWSPPPAKWLPDGGRRAWASRRYWRR